MKYEYKKGKFIKNGHTMFEQDVLQDLKRLDFLEKERTEQLLLLGVSRSLPKEEPIFLTCDNSDGEIFAGFTDEDRCRAEAKECGCSWQKVTLYR